MEEEADCQAARGGQAVAARHSAGDRRPCGNGQRDTAQRGAGREAEG